MAHFKKILQKKNEGKIVYCDGIVKNIVALAVAELDNVALSSIANKAISVVIDKKNGVVVDVCVKLHFSQSVSDAAFKVQEAVRHNVETMTEYHIVAVNVHVMGVNFDDEEENTAQ